MGDSKGLFQVMAFLSSGIKYVYNIKKEVIKSRKLI